MSSLLTKFSIVEKRKRRNSKPILSTIPDFKVVTLGESGCGKTSLVQWFLKQRQISDLEIGATVAASFSRYKFEDDDSPDVDGTVMGLWDTAGSERFLTLSKLYYRDVFGALLCYDVSDDLSWNRLRYWINELQEHQPDARIYIIGCKADLPRQICPEKVTLLVEKYNSVFYETSSRTGFQVNEVFQHIYEDYKEEKRIKMKLTEEEDETESVETVKLSEHQTENVKRCSC